MSDYERLGVGQAIHALSIKLADIQRELAALRQDSRKILYLLESQQTKTHVSDQSDLGNTKLESSTRV
ncbi:MAG: hypothetical protein ABFD54_10850 [Armatimonadota bacterium]|nr:hypothetical protein [bacterium]